MRGRRLVPALAAMRSLQGCRRLYRGQTPRDADHSDCYVETRGLTPYRRAIRRRIFMYARVTTFKVDPSRVAELPAKVAEMGPRAKRLPGVVEIYAAWRSDGQGVV